MRVGDCLPEEIAYRICAIRELFEETGILLARKKEEVVDFPVHGLSPGTVSPVVMSLSDATLTQWRERVHDNAYNFITMCRLVMCLLHILCSACMCLFILYMAVLTKSLPGTFKVCSFLILCLRNECETFV